ncbi:aminotransferase in exopolysaccharide biosynthesis [Marinilabilia salmonicolor]|jgi:aminotransferase in exopolysaccharide biosynthesis|uniref:LegC family aminotransferase n=1 Tax=Marinilabilia salmonicolor TaxID=989 RepID=UPI000D05D3D6|nr:LegC family aminotransferase [Marinilabilia salmonicolor]PRY94362.1 aminotransferase in exopolysaccharide biosynthesis [Marinilabilia salmonicolor]
MQDYSSVIEFIRETFHTPEAFIPLHEPRFLGNEKKYLEECIDSTFVSSVGKFVDRFEEMVTEFTGTNKAVVCVNGTNALHLALQLSNVRPDDEVITQPLTFIATGNAISYCGASPVFVDVDRDTLGLSPQKLEEWLEENVDMRNGKAEVKNNEAQPYNKSTGRRIAACVPMHTFGHPCRIDKIVEVCNRYNIKVVEDAAESLGSYYKNQHTGTFADIGVLSFNGNKTITTGGGGMLLFKDKAMGEYAKHLTTQAKMPHKWEFRHDHIGYNYRMPNINAALGCAQMEQLPKFLKVKRELAKRYDRFFSSSSFNSVFVNEPSHSNSNYWLNAILLNNKEEREHFLEQTNEAGVMTRPVWELMNTLPMFRKCEKGDLSNAEWLADRLVNIPSSVIL